MNIYLNNRFLQKCTLSVLLLCLFVQSLEAQLPAGFTDVKMQDGYIAPMGVIFSKNGQKMFVWEKSGVLWVSTWNGTSYVKQTTPVLDISEEVGNWRDYGFSSVVLDPNFDTNGLIYLYYQVDRHHLLYFGTPQYSSTTNEYFNATIGRVTRYRLNTAGATWTTDYATRQVLIGATRSTGIPILHESHAGGQLIFGTDGTLLLSTGDGAGFIGVDAGNAGDTFWQQALTDGIIRPTENVGAFRSQMLNSFSGKILRFDPATGNGLVSNPFYNAAAPRSAQSLVWTLGLRNPYRMSLKTDTGSPNPSVGNPGTLFVADVQWATWEEMNVIERSGLNCGWPLYEGIEILYPYFELATQNTEEAGSPLFNTLCTQPTSPIINPTATLRRFDHAYPAIDWSHSQNIARSAEFINNTLVPTIIGTAGSSIAGTPFKGNTATSGTYYAGKSFPPNYTNVYFFADYSVNWIKAAVVHDNEDHRIHEIRDFVPEGYCNGVVDIEYCPADGSIFYVNINSGDIHRINFGSGNNPPLAVISSDKIFGTSPLTVSFTGNGSSDPDGDAITYAWDFGDGSPISTVANPTHTFIGTGITAFTVKLTVTDINGAFDSETRIISVNNTPPSVTITDPLNNAQYVLSQPTDYNLRANITDNDLSNLQYAWQVTLRHNNHEHREPILNTATPTARISPVGCDGETYYYLIELTVTDNGGLTGKDSVKIYPDCSSANISVTNLTAIPQTNSVNLNWVNPIPATVFDEVMVVAKANTGFLSNPSGTAYVANANFLGNGTAFEGGKVVYRGKNATVNITGLTGGTRYFFRVFTRQGTAWTGGVETSAIPLVPVCTGDGKLYVETWSNIGSSTCISAIPLSNTPTTATTVTLTGFEAPANPANNFGMRLRGYVCAPETGEYTFYLSSDNAGILYLSTDTNPSTKQTIAFLPSCGYTNFRQWTKYPEQTSVKIALVAGQRYYIEAQFKESDGGEHLSVGWQTPSAPTAAVQIIPASSLTAFIPPTTSTDDGKLYIETWSNIGSSTCVSAIPLSNTPTTATTVALTGFEAPANPADNFGMRLRGYVSAPETGEYTFYLSSDNAGILFLSTNTDPATKQTIAFLPSCGYTNLRQWTKYPEQKSVKIALVAGQKYYIEAQFKESGGGEHLSVGWQMPSAPTAAVQIIPASSLSAFVPPNTCTGDSKLYVDIWSNISTSTCYGDVPVNTAPTTTSTVTVSAFEAPANATNNFGMRLRGYICAPETGAYSFYVSSDNSGVLYLSTNDNPANKQQIAFIPNCDYTNFRQWTKYPQQKSVPINLIAGQKYYIEAVFKEGDGGEHLSVGWQRPSAPTAAVQVIPASLITAFVPTAPVGFDPTKCYKLTNRLSNRVLEIPNASLVEGIDLSQGTDTINLKHKLWRLKLNGDSTYTILNTNSGYVADVAEDLLTNGAAVVQWTSNLGNNQRWSFTRNTEGYYTIVAKHSNLALAVLNNSTAHGALIVQNTPSTTALGQQWTVAEATCPIGALSLQTEHVFAVQGYRDGKKAVITWISNANHNKDYFIVEKINNNTSKFERLEYINASTRKGNQNYTVIDNEPLDGENFYRVTMYKEGLNIPLNSEIIKLDFSHLQDFMLFPNPANDYIDIDLENVINKKVTLSVMDISGYVLKQVKIESATDLPYRLSLEGLQNGSYLIRIETQGRRAALKQFVIIK
jgi:glucose/arabinose dehydrogenase